MKKYKLIELIATVEEVQGEQLFNDNYVSIKKVEDSKVVVVNVQLNNELTATERRNFIHQLVEAERLLLDLVRKGYRSFVTHYDGSISLQTKATTNRQIKQAFKIKKDFIRG